MRCIDLFAGWGGFSLGAEAAGAQVLFAANHWPTAVACHSANHPRTRHVCQDLRQFDYSQVPEYDILLAAPACQGHSSASLPNRRPYHDALRATAWSVVDCVEVTRPLAFAVENVPRFMRWDLFPLWLEALRRLGYRARPFVLDATRFGAPQRRRRLFVLGSRVGDPAHIRLPAVQDEVAFGPFVDWERGHWRPISQAKPGARRRMNAGRARHGERFFSQHVTNHPGVPVTESLRTVTTKDQWCAVRGGSYRPLSTREYARAMAFPESYRWPEELSREDVVRGLGNAVCPPVAEYVVSALGELVGASLTPAAGTSTGVA